MSWFTSSARSGGLLKLCLRASRVSSATEFLLFPRNHNLIILTNSFATRKDKSFKPFLHPAPDPLFQQPQQIPQLQSESIEKYSTIYRNDLSLKPKIEHILNLYEHAKYTGSAEMPDQLSVPEMRDLLVVFPDERELLRSLKFFYKRECSRYGTQLKKAARKIEVIETRKEKFNITGDKELDDDWEVGVWDKAEKNLIYGLWHNTLLSRIPKQAVRDYRNNHLMRQAAMFGQKLIIDLDYDDYMKVYESRLLSQQIGILYYENRVNRDHRDCLPFDVHFTNCAKGAQTVDALHKHLKRIDQLENYFHQDSYLDLPKLFPKERLVYLSPHARDPLRLYSHDDIYILGGYNDRSSHMAVSHVKAQQEGIRCRRLPLDEQVQWRQGSRNLTLNQCSAILHSMKATNDWRQSILEGAPQRKMKSPEEVLLENEIRTRNLNRRMKSIENSYALDKMNKNKNKYRY